MTPAADSPWLDPDTPAVCLLALGVDRHPETDESGRHLLCLNWTLATWIDEITGEIGRPPHPRALSRFGAALGLLHNPDEYYHSVPGFHHICEGLAADWFDTDTDHPLTTDEIVRGVIEAHMIHPPAEDEQFSPSVIHYINRTVRGDGFAKLPDMIKAFGIPTDRSVEWGHDLSGDPFLAEIAAAGDDDRQTELVDSTSDFLMELADQLERLPLRHLNSKAAADDIRRRIPNLPKR